MSKWLEKQMEREEEEARLALVDSDMTVAEIEEAAKNGSQFRASEFKPGDYYTWTEHDTVSDFYELVRRMHTTKERLMEFNEIEDLGELEPGIAIHFPVSTGEKKPQIRYEILPEEREMHIVADGGAKKWAFGNVKTWEDFKASGFYPKNTNIKIVAVAHVPVEDTKDPEAGFYLDSLAVGDYDETGRVKYTVGYRWKDLAEGIYVPPAAPAPEPATEVPKEDKLAERKAVIASVLEERKQVMDVRKVPVKHDGDGFDPKFVDKRLADTLLHKNSHHFVETYQAQHPPIPCMAFIPDDTGEVEAETGRRFIWIKDFETRRPDRKLYQHQEINVAGTFQLDGVHYGRPEKSAQNFLWFGIPMDLLQSQHHVYNEPTETAARIADGRFTTFERLFWVPISKLAHSRRFQRKNKNNESKE